MSDDIKFLKYKAKILAVNTGDKDDRLGKTIIVKHFRGFPDGFTLTPDMTLREIVEREFNTEPQKPKVTIRKAGSGSGIIVPDAGTYKLSMMEHLTSLLLQQHLVVCLNLLRLVLKQRLLHLHLTTLLKMLKLLLPLMNLKDSILLVQLMVNMELLAQQVLELIQKDLM